MKREIPTDPILYDKLVSQVSMRLQASLDWYRGHREQWRADYEIWHRYPARPLAAGDEDEFEIQLGYAFGLGEQSHAKIVQPLVSGGVPYKSYPTEFGDQPAADNFQDMSADYYAKPHVQAGKMVSKKEMVICGPRWEVYEWMHTRVRGMKWADVPEAVEGADGASITEMVPKEVETDITLNYGFATRYPSVFNMYPEPDRTTIDTGQKTDISWVVEDMGELAIEDLAREVIYDPITKKDVPRYDFSKLLAAAGPRAQARYADIAKGLPPKEDGFGVLITPVHDWTDARGKWNTSGERPRDNDAVANESYEDRDKVWVCQMRTINSIITVFQGRFIGELVTDPWHRPRLGVNIENYTTDPRCIYGPGLLRTIFAELKALDISKSLELQNFFRNVNNLIVVQPEKLITLDDLDARASGIVRASPEVEDVRSVVYPLKLPSAANESLTTESGLKGDIEFVASTMSPAPGPQGTRQGHKTARGLDAIASIVGSRFGVMAAQALISECILGENMLYMTEQFHWEKVSYRSIQDDGTTVYKKFDRTDISTDGRGLRLLISVDPTWGNTSQQRQDSLDMLDEGIKYEELRAKLKDPTMKKFNISAQFEDVLKKFGRRDLSGIFVRPTGEISPEQEMEIIAQGGAVQCKGDLMEHAQIHLLQAQSPALDKAIESGKAHPKTKTRLLMLVDEDTKRMAAFLRDPQSAAMVRLNSAGMAAPGGAT